MLCIPLWILSGNGVHFLKMSVQQRYLNVLFHKDIREKISFKEASWRLQHFNSLPKWLGLCKLRNNGTESWSINWKIFHWVFCQLWYVCTWALNKLESQKWHFTTDSKTGTKMWKSYINYYSWLSIVLRRCIYLTGWKMNVLTYREITDVVKNKQKELQCQKNIQNQYQVGA